MSFHNPSKAQRFAVFAAHEANLLGVDDGVVQDVAYVEQRLGPTMPTPWLQWSEHENGFSYAWHVEDSAPDKVRTPAGWTAERSRQMIRGDLRDRSDMLVLGEEEGVEYWLDLSTGEQSQGFGHGYLPHLVRFTELAASAESPLPPKRRADAARLAALTLRENNASLEMAIAVAERRRSQIGMEGSAAQSAVADLVCRLLRSQRGET